jgi:PAS domain S-box-containing protein
MFQDSTKESDVAQDDLLEVVLESADDGLVVFDVAGGCRGMNTAARKLLELQDGSEVSDVQSLIQAVPRRIKAHLERLLVDSQDESHMVAGESKIRLRRRCSASGWVVLSIRESGGAQTLRETNLLARIGRLRSSESRPTDFPSQILQLLFEELPLDVAVFAVLDRDVLRPVAWQGLLLDPIGAPISLTNPVIQRAVSTREVIPANGTELSLSFDSDDYFVVPLTRDGVVHGILQMSFVASVQESWGKVDLGFLKALGEYIAHALQNVMTFQKLVDEENRLRLLVQSLPEGVLVFDGRGEVLVSNPAACEILEMNLMSLNKNPRPYQLRDASMKVLARAEWPFFRAARLGHMIQDESIIMDFEGRFKCIEVSVLLLPGVDGRTTHFLATLRDVTQRTEDDKRKDEFLSVASHELRSPLTPLRGLIQMALQQVERGEKVDVKVLRRANEQTHRLSRLIDDLLDVSRIDSGHLIVSPEEVDLLALTTSLITRFWPEVRVACDRAVMGWVDPQRIEQVLVNLVENARKHSAHRSPIEIRISETDNTAVICVWDDGQGIAPEHLPRIFDRFYRLAHPASGTGLGLNISRQIIEQHGGQMRMESELGRGTTVFIELPQRSH